MKIGNGNTGLIGEFIRWRKGPGGHRYAEVMTPDGKRLIYHRHAHKEGSWEFYCLIDALRLQKEALKMLAQPSPWLTAMTPENFLKCLA